MELQRPRIDPVIIQLFRIELCILDMEVEKLVLIVFNRFDVIHTLPYKMRRIVIQPEIIARNRFEHSVPEIRAACQIHTGRPLIPEIHRTVFDADLNLFFFCQFNDIRPDLHELLPVMLRRRCLVFADKGINNRNIQFCRSFYDLFDMPYGNFFNAFIR